MPAYFRVLVPDPRLDETYVVLAQAAELWAAAAARPGSPTRAHDRERAIKLRVAYQALARDFALLGIRGAPRADQFIREHIRLTIKRQGRHGTQMADAVHSDAPLTLSVGGGVQIASLAALDAGTINPTAVNADGMVPYWRAQEYGTRKHIGRQVYGFFEPGRAAPSPGAFRAHPYFEAGPGKRMIIRRPIEARHFLQDGTRDFALWHTRESQQIMTRAIAAMA